MPMIRPPLESLLEKVDNKYSLVITVAKRARQLKEGHLPMVDIGSNNPVTVALEEIAAGKVRPEKGQEKGPEKAAEPAKV
jgi:DNA-directed RNA polymerase subunit omega